MAVVTGDNDHILAMVMNNFAMLNLKLKIPDKAVFFIHQSILLHRESKSNEKKIAHLLGIVLH